MDLHGHGDPLLVAAMKNMAIKDRQADMEQKQNRVTCHSMHGHGDPLFQATQKGSYPLKRASSFPMLALRSEFRGHGDPLMDKVLKTWKGDALELKTNVHEFKHGERKMHGDPLFKAFVELDRRCPSPVDPGFRGQGDPLMKRFLEMWEEDTSKSSKENLHEVMHGEYKKHGDPLLQEFLKIQDQSSTVKRTSSLPMLAFRSEFSGHGDPLMEKVLDTWKGDALNVKEENVHETKHEECKKQGDPLFKAFLELSAAEGHSRKAQ